MLELFNTEKVLEENRAHRTTVVFDWAHRPANPCARRIAHVLPEIFQHGGSHVEFADLLALVTGWLDGELLA
jgi:hypothetical protein